MTNLPLRLATLTFLALPLAGAEGWPAWRGPNGSGCASPCGKPIVDDLVNMKQVWQSEARDIPGNCWHDGRHGGYDSPIVADGKVIFSYQKGSGDIVDTTVGNRGIKRWKNSGQQALLARVKECQAVAADFHVICIDAANGKTLWNVILDTGPNMYQRRKRPGMHHSPCYHDGKVYAQSTLGRVYCLEAEDGSVVWKADVPKTADQLKILEGHRKAGVMHPYRGHPPEELKGYPLPYSFQHPLQIADGVVVAHGGPLVAFDAATGERLWKGRSSGHCSPLRWVSGDKEYLIVGTRLLEPKTGKELWNIKGAHCSMTPTIGDGYLVFSQRKVGIMCYAITPAGFDKKWTVPDYGTGIVVGVIHDGWYYAQVKGPKGSMGKDVVELVVAHELSTGKLAGKLPVVGLSQTLCTSLVATDKRLFGMAGAGYSGMWMAAMEPDNFRFVGLRVPTNKSYLNTLPDDAGNREKLDFLLTSTPAIVDGHMYWRGKASVFCYDLRK